MKRQIVGGVVVVAVLSLVLAEIQTASAQPGGGGRGFGRRLGGIPKAQLATLNEVQTELKLNDETKTKIGAINDKLRSDRRELFSGGFGNFSEMQGKREQLNRKAADDVDALLDDAQKKRLLEISIQVNGPKALNDPAVVEQLKLSEEQKTKLEGARAENNKAFEDAFAEGGQLSDDERRERGQALGDAADARLLGVLADQQKAEFDEMKGQPLQVDTSPLNRRPGQ